MNFEIYNQLTQTCNQALKKHTPPNNVNAETSTEHKQKLSKGKKIAFCSTAAVLAVLGIYCATRGRSGGAAVKNAVNHNAQTTVNHTVNSTPSTNNAVNHVDDFINNFLKGADDEVEQVFLNHNFSQYGKNGIPLKYSRNQFIQDIDDTIKALPKQQQDDILKQFNLTKSSYDINGIPTLTGNIDNSPESQKIKTLIENFYKQNETTITDPKAKKAFDTVIKGFPEFNMTIRKLQHGTHIYSVDIHSLKVLQKAMNHPSYKALSDESKEVIKLTALVHDFGKKGKVITTGHAAISKKDVELFIDSYNLPKNIKDRVLNQVENHHWFEQYNKGIIDEQGVVNIFKTPEDLEIAKILAKGDFESVNPTFHLGRMNPSKTLTQAEFDQEFAAKMAKIGAPAPKAVQQTAQKAGRTLQEQIQHLENNYTSQKMFSKDKEVTLFTNPKTNSQWVKIDNDLYFIPEINSPNYDYANSVYSKITGQNTKSAEIHQLTPKADPFVAEEIRVVPYFSNSDALVSNPKAIYKGFGLDCLFSTPVSSKYMFIDESGNCVRYRSGLEKFESRVIPYSEQTSIPTVILKEKVIELSEHFQPNSSSYKYLKDMTRDELISSLESVSKLKDTDLIAQKNMFRTIDVTGLEEKLITRKNYIKEFVEKCKQTPQKQGETMGQYTKRIESLMPNHFDRPSTLPFMDNYLPNRLKKAEIEALEECYSDYLTLSKQKIVHNAGGVITPDNLLHGTSISNLESILDNGIVSGELNIGKKLTQSTAGGNATRTHAMADTFKVNKNETISEYFANANKQRTHSQECEFLPINGSSNPHKNNIAVIINKKVLPQSILENSFDASTKQGQKLQDLANFHSGVGFETHYAVPIGVPATSIDRIIVRPELELTEVARIKSEIAKRGLDIKVFNTDGVLL